MNPVLEKAELFEWFPSTPYYQEHADRFLYSFANLPNLPRGFSCLAIGSWGTEAPLLAGALGAGRIVCIRAPVVGLPEHESRRIQAPNGFGVDVELYSLNIETDELPRAVKGVDLVIGWEVLEHLNLAPERMVWQAISALRVGGILSLTTPNSMWHVYTNAHLCGKNALGLRLQHHIPFATHWRLYSVAEVKDLVEKMGCTTTTATSFLRNTAFSVKSWLFLRLLNLLRRHSGNGSCSFGQHVFVLARKEREEDLYRPGWLYPHTVDTGAL